MVPWQLKRNYPLVPGTNVAHSVPNYSKVLPKSLFLQLLHYYPENPDVAANMVFGSAPKCTTYPITVGAQLAKGLATPHTRETTRLPHLSTAAPTTARLPMA